MSYNYYMNLIIEFDGSARPNPGNGGCGIVIKNKDTGETIKEISIWLN